MRRKRCGPYTADEELRLQSMVPHPQTAFALQRLHKAEALAHASVHTLRSHFRTIATKAGVGRQTDLCAPC